MNTIETDVKDQLAAEDVLFAGIVHRSAILDVVNRLKCRRGVEVGTCKGTFANIIVHRWNPNLFDSLSLVDTWAPYGAEDQNLNLRRIKRRYRRNSKVSIFQEDSVTASKNFGDGSIDWVFIDGDHSYEGVKADIEAWWPKVRLGGLFSGHDYGKPRMGVRRAVTEFALVKGLRVHETDNHSSWMILKTVK